MWSDMRTTGSSPARSATTTCASAPARWPPARRARRHSPRSRTIARAWTASGRGSRSPAGPRSTTCRRRWRTSRGGSRWACSGTRRPTRRRRRSPRWSRRRADEGTARGQGVRHHRRRRRDWRGDRRPVPRGGRDGGGRGPARGDRGRGPRAGLRRGRRGRGAGDVRAGPRGIRAPRRAVQQRRHLPRRRRVRARHLPGGVAARAGREPQVGVPVLQARHPAPAGRRRGLGDQHRVVRGRDGRGHLADLLHGVQGRGALALPRARRGVRPPRRARQRALPRAGGHAAAARALRVGPGEGRAAADPRADGALRRGPGDRLRRAVFGLRRVVVRDRVDVHGRRRHLRRLRHPRMSDDGYFDADVAAGYDDPADVMFQPAGIDPVVDLLVELAGGGRALELGIGTGRIALPLAARGVPVHGIELSRAMAARLRAKPGGDAVPITIGDFATARADGPFSVAYVVFNTIGNLTTQAEQVACFGNVAAHLRPGGRFVIEVGVPDLRRLPPGETYRAFHVGEDSWGFDEYDVAGQGLISHHFSAAHGRMSIPFRYVWPAELDLMAELAGMRLQERWSGWGGGALP